MVYCVEIRGGLSHNLNILRTGELSSFTPGDVSSFQGLFCNSQSVKAARDLGN